MTTRAEEGKRETSPIEEELAKVSLRKDDSDDDDDSDFVPVGFDYDGFNSMADGILQLEKPAAQGEKKEDILSYDFLLARIEKHLKPSDAEAESKLKIPMSIRRDGSTKTSLNITEICSILHRDVYHLKQYLEVELSVTCSVDSDGRLVIKGIFPEAQIQKMVRNYIKQYVTCGICSSLSTVLEKEGKLLFKKCKACGATQSVNAITQGFKALTTKRSILRRKIAE